MGFKEWQWVEWANLGGLFIIHWKIPWPHLLEDFLHTWESTEDWQIRRIICGEKITIDQVLIIKRFGVNAEGVVDATNTLVKEAQDAFKNKVGLDAFVNKG